MNIIVCQKKNLLKPFLSYINLEKFIIVSSLLNLQILSQNHTIDIVIYEDTLNLDKKLLKKNIKKTLSFSEFIQQITIKKEMKNKNETEPVSNNANPKININKTNNIVDNSHINIPIINTKNTNINNTFQDKHSSIIIDSRAKKNITNNIYTFTSVKGGIGVSSLILELIKIKKNKLILDLSFIDGGSDLSYYLDLPQIPHISTYLEELEEVSHNDALVNNTIALNKYTRILQAPSSKKIYKNIISNDIIKILTQNIGNILIDIPFYSKYISDVLNTTTKLFILTTGTAMEVNRINTMFNNYKNNIVCIVINAKDKNYLNYFRNFNLEFILYEKFLKTFSI